MRIFFFGCGAVGSNIALNLAYDRKDWQYVLIDKDKIEDRNIIAGTQGYFRDQMGMLKTKAMRLNLYKLSGVEAEAVNISVENTKSIDNIVQDIVNKKGYGDECLFVDGFDNREARGVVYEYAKSNNVPCVHIGFSGQKTYEITWNEKYELPTIDKKVDICAMPGMRSFIFYVTGLASSIIQHYSDKREKINVIGNQFMIAKI